MTLGRCLALFAVIACFATRPALALDPSQCEILAGDDLLATISWMDPTAFTTMNDGFTTEFGSSNMAYFLRCEPSLQMIYSKDPVFDDITYFSVRRTPKSKRGYVELTLRLRGEGCKRHFLSEFLRARFTNELLEISLKAGRLGKDDDASACLSDILAGSPTPLR